MKTLSAREAVQNKIVEFLEKHEDYFNAPYGILSGQQKYGKGKVRVVTFGVSRYLDASIKIYTPNHIVVRGQGGLDYKFEGEFTSAEELIRKFSSELPKKEVEVSA